MVVHQLIIPEEVNRELACLGRDDLPPTLAIDQVRAMYPWLDKILIQLQEQAQMHVERETDKLFREALTSEGGE